MPETHLLPLALAMLGFVGGHFLLSYPPLRSALIARLGEKPFQAIYSTLSLAFLVWAVTAYGQAPSLTLWDLEPFGRYLALAVMPLAMILVVAGLLSRNPTAVGGERLVGSEQAVAGIVTVTRHPFLWGVGLWSLVHLLANGDAASLILFGGMAVLSFGGMAAIDHKRSVALGATWQTLAGRTSRLPFLAVLQGRTRIDWAGIGWWRPALGLAAYAVLLQVHGWLFGMAAID
ncbi:putative membrane protein [Sulfuritortus calidifontis]|uniref:Putative membrane protein n=1 Tax=Sulfuritortus calidifontis TaxID=1914471 RepID=A0A4R3JUK7_9PROT|nr:NnrU family protein [Sulfuritortus calidifontis]TCS71507.1 putative membrane protein [Sulfuritortus calidifontis]